MQDNFVQRGYEMSVLGQAELLISGAAFLGLFIFTVW